MNVVKAILININYLYLSSSLANIKYKVCDWGLF